MAIAFYIKRGNEKEKPATVRHSERWGLEQQKNDWLFQHDLQNTEWQEIVPTTPYYLFVPYNQVSTEEFQRFVSVTDIFPIHVTGIVSGRDNLVIDFNKTALMAKIRPLCDPNVSDDYIKSYLKEILSRRDTSEVENYAWRVSEARESLQKLSNLDEYVTPILYRPFDTRYVFYHNSLVWRTRQEVMCHMLAGENLALMTCRQLSGHTWGHVMVSNLITDDCMVSNRTRERGYLFPLYLYDTANQRDLFSQHPQSERECNLNPKLVEALTQAYGTEPSPEQIFHYVYAILYAEAYREKYANFLKREFPRIPFTSNVELFQKLSALGQSLVELHLLRSPELDQPLAQFEGEGDYRVAKTKGQGFLYKPEEECVYINKAQYFAPVPLPVWEYQIGGYQVCEKWLKDRKGRRLDLEDIRTYCRIVTALKRTIEIQKELNALYPQVEAELLDIKL